MNLDTLVREGAEPLTPEELRTLDKVRTHYELYQALDHATTGGGDAVGDRAIRKAFGVAVGAIREQLWNYPTEHADDMQSEVILKAFDAIANWTKKKFDPDEERQRTPGAYRAYINGAVKKRLATAGTRAVKATEKLLEVEWFDMPRRPAPSPWKDRELIAKFAEFFHILHEPDQLILTPLPFDDVPILEWPWRSAVDVLDRFQEDEERARQLSDRWNVHPAEVFRRLENLYCMWTSFLRRGTYAFDEYISGPA